MFYKLSSGPAKQQEKGVPKANFEEKWKLLQEGVNKLIDFLDSKAKKPYNYDEHAALYATVYNLCTQKVDTGKLTGGPTELLYERYKKCISMYLTDRVVPYLKQKQGETLLTEAVSRWRDHEIVVRWMCKVFNYLDRFYTKHNNRDSLRDVGLKCYQQMVYESIKKDMATALLAKIQQERNGETIDRGIMKDGVNLFIEMGLSHLSTYEKDFEAPLLFETSNYYKIESAKWIAEDSCPDYMKKAEERLNQELNRAQGYLHPTTEPNLLRKVEAELISSHAQRLLEMENSGFVPLLRDYKTDDLSRMYRLFKRVNNLKPMAENMRDYVTDEGNSLVQSFQEKEELDGIAFIESLLSLHEKYSKLVNIEFEKDSLFLESLKDAFTNFVNSDLVDKKSNAKKSCAELLSSYCDNVMRNTEKYGDEAMDELLDKIVKLFGYLSDKDLFQEFYRRQLSKRLLVVSKGDHDYERSLIAKLKMRCGAGFTSKFEGMIKDKTLSEDLQNAFHEYLQAKGKQLPVESFVPKVLTTGFWPAFKIDSLVVPDEFGTCTQIFKEFYDSRTESRSLKWVHSLGTCQILARYAGGSKDLVMSSYQTCCLLLFNNNDMLKAEDVQKTLTLPMNDVKANLLALSLSKILNKTGKPKVVSSDDEFTVNNDFTSKTRRIKVMNLVLTFTKGEVDDIANTTMADRKHAIEAAIVRIMKARKVLSHQNLMTETIRQLSQHFKPDPKVIKGRVEDLISRDYLERDDANSNMYKYVA